MALPGDRRPHRQPRGPPAPRGSTTSRSARRSARVRADEDALLGGAPAELLPDLRCHLLGLETLLRAHIEREERYLMPLLEDDAWVSGQVELTT